MQLKTLKSLISPNELISLVKENYHFSIPIKITLLNSGDNDHYLIESINNKYVLRVYRYNKYWLKSKSNYLFELAWLRYLKSYNINVSAPIIRKDNKFIGELNASEGKRFWAIFDYLEGDNTELSIQNIFNLGASIAKIHLLSKDFKTKYKRINIEQKFLITDPYTRIKNSSININTTDLKTLDDIVKRLEKEVSIFALKRIPSSWGVIGGDFHQYNYLIHNKYVVNLIDFDLCGYGWNAYDIAVFRWSLLNKKQETLKWNKFLEGYLSVKQLCDEELKIIPALVKARQIWMMGAHTTYNDMVLTKEYWRDMFNILQNAEKLL